MHKRAHKMAWAQNGMGQDGPGSRRKGHAAAAKRTARQPVPAPAGRGQGDVPTGCTPHIVRMLCVAPHEAPLLERGLQAVRDRAGCPPPPYGSVPVQADHVTAEYHCIHWWKPVQSAGRSWKEAPAALGDVLAASRGAIRRHACIFTGLEIGCCIVADLRNPLPGPPGFAHMQLKC